MCNFSQKWEKFSKNIFRLSKLKCEIYLIMLIHINKFFESTISEMSPNRVLSNWTKKCKALKYIAKINALKMFLAKQKIKIINYLILVFETTVQLEKIAEFLLKITHFFSNFLRALCLTQSNRKCCEKCNRFHCNLFFEKMPTIFTKTHFETKTEIL